MYFHGNRNSNLFHIFIACDNNAVSEIFCISFKINNLQDLQQKLYNWNQMIIKIILLWDIVSQRMFNIIYSKPVNTTHAKNEGLFNECWCCDDIILNIKKVLHMNGYLSSLNLCNIRTCIRHFILINMLNQKIQRASRSIYSACIH